MRSLVLLILLLFGKLFIDKYIYPKPRKKEHIKVKELKEKHKKKIQQFEEEYEMKLRQMKESQALELKNVKQECANMMGGDAKKKNS